MRFGELRKLLGRQTREQHTHPRLLRMIENVYEMRERLARAENRFVESQPLAAL